MNLTLPSEYDFLGRFYRLVLVSILSNLMVPLAGLVSRRKYSEADTSRKVGIEMLVR